jgi:hypothetical protein
MKRVLSVLLACLMLLGIPLGVSAATAHNPATCTTVPIINLGGALKPMFLNEFQSNEKQIFSSDADALTTAMDGLLGKLSTELLKIPPNWDGIADVLSNFMWDYFGEIAMDATGTSVNPVTCEHDPERGADNRDAKTQDHLKNNAYEWAYDWRMNPVDLAVRLKDFINVVKQNTGHTKVNLRAPSGAATIVSAYLDKYGYGDVAGVLYWTPMHQGMSLVGQLACKELAIDSKALADSKLFEILNLGDSTALIQPLLKILSAAGLLNIVAGVGNAAIDRAIDRLYAKAITPLMFQMPMLWSYVPDEYYERAKTIQFGNDPKYAELIKKIDSYHNVQKKADSLLLGAKKAGVKTALVVGYGYSGLPFVKKAETNTDNLLEVQRASSGGTAVAFDKKFPATYVQAVQDGHDHISPDRQIDASTGILPDQTWYIKYLMHADPGKNRDALVNWFFSTPGALDVRSSATYPQFLQFDAATDTFSPVPEARTTARILDLFLDIIMRMVNIVVRFGTWWLPIFGITPN